MRRPNVERFKVSQDKRSEQWIEKTVRPYLTALLARAQARLTRHRIVYVEGMGVARFAIEPESTRPSRVMRLSESVEAMAYVTSGGVANGWYGLVNDRDRRYGERFPELVEFMVIVQEVDDAIGEGSVGDIELD